MKEMNAALMADDIPWCSGNVVDYIYGTERVEKIASLTNFHPVRVTSENLEEELPKLKEIEAIFSCWGMLPVFRAF